jgi:DNA (cytosine-5)-methyltransferase 1
VQGGDEVKYISICSGIEAASTAWHGLGWTPLAFSEIEPFPSAVLAQRHPNVPNLGDMSKYREWPEELLAECELLVGGTPCQAFSVAGLRKSLDDERGNLSLIYVHLFHHINEIRRKHGRSPAIALWENVPGVLSTKDNAFGCFISGLLGVDDTLETQDGKWPKAGFLGSETVRVGYRVLDAQYFAVAQRRRRVFLVAVPCELVASLGERACPSEILSLRESVLGNPPTRGEARQAVAGGSAERAASGGGCGEPYHPDRAMFNQGVNAQYEPQITDDGVAASMVARGPAAVMWNASDQANAERLVDQAGTLNCNMRQRGGWIAPSGHPDPIAIPIISDADRQNSEALTPSPDAEGRIRLRNPGVGVGEDGDPMFTVQATKPHAVAFKPSHYTRGKDGKPDEVAPPLSADADKGDQDTLVMRQSIGFNWQNGGGYGNANAGGQIAVAYGVDTYNQTVSDVSIPLRVGNAKDSLPAAMVPFTKAKRAQSVNDDESWVPGEVAPTQNQFDVGDTRATTVVAFTQNTRDEVRQIAGDGQIAGALSAEAGMHQTNYLAFAPLQGGRSMPVTKESPTLEAGTGNKAPAVLSFKPGQSAAARSLGESREVSCTIEGAANGNAGHKVAVAAAMQVRRLTPTECCRLQGFPDDHCDIIFRKKPAADGPKYRALGNSMAVPCMAWLGYRIHLATHRDTP